MSFNDIINQSKAKEIITGQLKSGHIPHAFLFLGPEGVGRKKAALELAKSLNCQIAKNLNFNPCDHCLSCKKIAQGIHPDVRIIDFSWQAKLENKDIEKQKSIKIDTIRALQREISLKPIESKWKVFIIEPAEKITLEAANCLLKTLEEPPSWTLIILLAKHKENLPATIVSRTQIILFSPLSDNEVVNYLKNKHNVADKKAMEIAKIAEGSLSQAISKINNNTLDVESFLENIKKNNLPINEILSYSQQYSKTANEFLLELLANIKNDFRDNPVRYKGIIEDIIYSQKLIERNVNSQMVLDNFLIKLKEQICQ